MGLRDLFQRTSSTAALGRRGERLAARYLRRKGVRVLERNLRTRSGEIDLLCLDPDRETIVFVEVKTRAIDPSNPSPFPPEANITQHKKRKLVALAKSIARGREWGGKPMRIDVVAVEVPPRGKATIRHYPGGVRGG